MNELCEQIDEFIDSQLDGVEAAVFEKHLEDCAVCQRVLQETKSCENELAEAWSSVLAPSSILESISGSTGASKLGLVSKSELSDSHRSRQPDRRWLFATTVVASIVVMTAVVLYLRSTAPSDSGQHASTILSSQTKKSSPQVDVQNDNAAVDTELPNFSLTASTPDTSGANPAILLAKTEDDFTIVKVYPIYEQTNKPTEQ